MLIYNQNSYCCGIAILRSTFLVISETPPRRNRRLSTCNVHTRDKVESVSWQPYSSWVSCFKFGRASFSVRFTTLVQSDRALPTCGASLSQLKRPFCASSSFPVCICFFFFYFSAVLLSWLWFFHPRRPSKRQKRIKNQNSWRYILPWCLLNHGLGLLQQNKKRFDWYFFNNLCYFLYTQFIKWKLYVIM
jgi:hypothetical protein